MDVCFINPPLSVHEFPHLALPLLKGYLTSRGISCTVKDYNVEIMDEIITEGLEKVVRYFNERGLKVSYREVQDRFQKARNVFLQKEFAGKAESAQKLINTYLRIAGSNIFDICFCPDSLQKIKEEYGRVNISGSSNKIIRYIRETILRDFQKRSFSVIGISVPFTSQIYYALILGRELKRINPNCKVVLGGPQISLFWRNFAEHVPFREAFDGMLYGMGEIALEKYIYAAGHGRGFSSVPNLIYIDDNGKIKVNPEEKIKNMDLIPMPDFSDLPLDKYIFAKLPYQMSRGCYWSQCAFCSYRNNKGYRIRNLETVAEHFRIMERQYDRHIFQFIDDAIHPDILTSFAKIILKRNMKIRYDAYLRLDKGFTEDVCRLLGKSGLKNVLFGFESANQRMLDFMKKGNTPENMLAVLKNMKKAGIQNILSCLIGFPTETREEAWDSIEFLKKNKAWYYWVYIVHFGLISDMCNHGDLYGLYDIDYKQLIRYDDSGFAALGYPYKTSIGMTVDEAYQVIKEGREALGITIFEDNFFS